MDHKRKYWSDILIALDAIEQHLSGIETLEAYAASFTAKDAVERRLITIGEAVTKIVQVYRMKSFPLPRRSVHSGTGQCIPIDRNHLAPLRKLAEAGSA